MAPASVPKLLPVLVKSRTRNAYEQGVRCAYRNCNRIVRHFPFTCTTVCLIFCVMVFGCFSHAFLINPDAAVRRGKSALLELGQVGVNQPERISGVVPIEATPYPSLGAKGCALSHCLAVRIALERDYSSILICEDDVIFRKNFLQLWSTELSSTVNSTDWDIFYFYRWLRVLPQPPTVRIGRIRFTFGTHCYAIRRQFFQKYLAIVSRNEKSTAPRHLDHLFHWPEVNSVATNYNLAGQSEGYSLIKRKNMPERWNCV